MSPKRSRWCSACPREPWSAAWKCVRRVPRNDPGGTDVRACDTLRLLVKLPAEKQNPGLMRAMFSTIAPRYDFITRTFSYGMDRRWKRMGVDRAPLPERPVVLDLASGTGDFSVLVQSRYPGARTVAVDLTERMLQLAHE